MSNLVYQNYQVCVGGMYDQSSCCWGRDDVLRTTYQAQKERKVGHFVHHTCQIQYIKTIQFVWEKRMIDHHVAGDEMMF